MVRAQIQFGERQYEQVRMLARRHSVSIAEAVRRLVEVGLEHGFEEEEEGGAAGLLALAGIGESGLGDLGREHDRYLDEAPGP